MGGGGGQVHCGQKDRQLIGGQTDIQEVQGLPTDRPRHKFSSAGQEVPGLQTERKLTDRQTDRQIGKQRDTKSCR